MTTISNKEEFINWLTTVDKDFDEKYFKRKYYFPFKNMVYLDGLNINNISINERDFECTEFKNCMFNNCDITFCIFSSSTFDNCQFNNCRFTWSKFIDVDLFSCKFNSCIITGLELSDAVLKNTIFQDCSEVLDLEIRGSRERVLTFNNCYLRFLRIEPIDEDEIEKINFIDCIIKESSFNRIDLTESQFNDCNLSLNQFSACAFSKNTFQGQNQAPGNEFNLIDIRTILNSTPINENNLSALFGIHNSDIKEYLVGLTTKIEFQSIFISYSFEDHKFAKIINEELSRRGILTFLWEIDSIGGATLKNIMSENIKEKDRLLFIASSHSLKSQACHFELTEGRKKQEKTWEDVLFPIHIDNFLFDVKKESIRPLEIQEEYWKNIQELKQMNSLSFEEFVTTETRDNAKFEKQILRLIKGLRKNK